MLGKTGVSNADTPALLKGVMNPPLEEESIDNLKRMEIVTCILLPEGHGFLSLIQDHISRFDNYQRKWRNSAMTNARGQRAKGAYHPQFLALRFSRY